MLTYPRPVREIHQIEVTTRCNLHCQYCPSPRLDVPKDKGGYGRKKEDMSWETFEQSLKLVKHYCSLGTQGELALTGIGEAVMHPRFVDMVAASREVIGFTRVLTFSTNGLLLDDALCERLKPYRPEIYVSLHRPEKAGPAVEAAKRAGLLAGTNVSAVTSSFDWAGQLKWHVSAPKIPCEYLRVGWAVILASGSIVHCCLNATGESPIGTIWDDPDTLKMAPYSLCKTCHMHVP